jgi:hypothetical protein
MGGPPQDPWYAIVSEIETILSRKKIEQAVRYATSLWLNLDRPVHVVFITPDPKASIHDVPLTLNGGGLTVTLHPCIYGPDQIPAMTDPDQVTANPALATLSVMAHGDRPDVGEAFMTGLSSLDPDDAPSYYEYAHRMATTSTRNALEALMSRTRTTPWPVSSPFAREHFGKGEAKGRAEGLAEGEAKGEAKALLTVLRAAGIEVSAQADHHIKSCTDLTQLESWLARAVTITSTDELFT